MSQPAIDTAIATLQQIFDRDYVHLEWRVLASPPVNAESDDQAIVYVYAGTRDFRYRCQVARPWTTVAAAPTLRLFVAKVAAEAERRLADQAATDPTS